MSWFTDLFKKKDKTKYTMLDFLNGRQPIYNLYGESIYYNEVVQDCMFRIVVELKKLKPLHIREDETTGDYIPQNRSIYSRALRDPNPLMTTNELIEKVSWNLLLNYNSFVYQMYDNGRLYLYPIQPTEVELLKNTNGEILANLKFASGYETTIPYTKLIHLRYKFSVNEFMGGNKQGKPDTDSLKKVLMLNDELLDGLKRQMKMNMKVSAVIKMKTMQNYDAQIKEIKEFERKLNDPDNEAGILPVDISSDFVPLNNKLDYLDETLLRFIDEKIYRPFGVSAAIMKVDYTKEQKEAFYETALEHLIISFNEAFSKKMFTERELGYGNKIMFFAKALQFCSMSQKIEVMRQLGDAGSVYENEKRVAYGLMPLAELVGVRMMSKNYGTVESVAQMDLMNSGGSVPPINNNEGGTENE